MLERVRAACEADPHLQAAMLYGSFALGEADRSSDPDNMLYFEDNAFPVVDRKVWDRSVKRSLSLALRFPSLVR